MTPQYAEHLSFLLMERAFRAKVRLRGNTVQASRFANLATRATRPRVLCVDGCDQCPPAELEAA
jgi:hypothetical protein